MFLAFPGRQWRVRQSLKDPSGTTILRAEPNPGKRRTMFSELIRAGSAVLVTSNRSEALTVLQHYQGPIEIVPIGSETDSFHGALVAGAAYLAQPQATIIRDASVEDGLAKVHARMTVLPTASQEVGHGD